MLGPDEPTPGLMMTATREIKALAYRLGLDTRLLSLDQIVDMIWKVVP